MSKYLKDPWTVRLRKWYDKKIHEWWTLKFGKWAAQYLWAFTWIWQKILYPILYRIYRLYRWFSNIYIDIWNKLTYKDGRFSRMRGGVMIIATIVFAYLAANFAFVSYQTTLYLTTGKYEQMYLHNSEEIGEDIHAIKGCFAFPCDESNSVYFRVRSTPFHQLWSIATHGHLFYPDATASVVAPGYNICNVVSYGFRLKMFMRSKNDNWYPDLLSASCSPYKNE